jgi:ferric-dicitrate binding protein FerR (iron transport regulator)
MAIGITTDLNPDCETGTTRIEVTDGVVYVSTSESEWVLTPGDAATMAAGVPYRRWNAGDDDAAWVEAYCA